MTPLQPGHENGGKARGAPFRLAVARVSVRPAGHFQRIGLGKQPLECLEALRIARVNRGVSLKLQSHAHSVSRAALGAMSRRTQPIAGARSYDGDDRKKDNLMLSTIVVVLLLVWLIGVATSYTMGGILHLLLIVAIAAALLRIIEGRQPIRG